MSEDKASGLETRGVFVGSVGIKGRESSEGTKGVGEELEGEIVGLSPLSKQSWQQ